MSIITIMPARAFGSRIRYDRKMPSTTRMVVLVGPEDARGDRPVWATLTRERLLWRDATLNLMTECGIVTIRGMRNVMTTLNSLEQEMRVRIALVTHEGYMALYGPDGEVAARILENESGLNVRIMNPHDAYTTNDPLDETIDAIFRRLEDGQDQKR